MRVVIGVLCFIVMVLLNPIESMISHFKKRTSSKNEISNPVWENIPKLSATLYMKSPGGRDELGYINPGRVYVEIKEIEGVEYVIGYVEDATNRDSLLYPFVVKSLKSVDDYIRIKIRVVANYAEKFIPLDKKDPLNTVFYKPYNPDSIRLFKVNVETSRRPLELFNPRQYTNPPAPCHASSNHASSSHAVASGAQPGHLLDSGPPEILDVTGDQVKKWRQPEEYNSKH